MSEHRTVILITTPLLTGTVPKCYAEIEDLNLRGEGVTHLEAVKDVKAKFQELVEYHRNVTKDLEAWLNQAGVKWKYEDGSPITQQLVDYPVPQCIAEAFPDHV